MSYGARRRRHDITPTSLAAELRARPGGSGRGAAAVRLGRRAVTAVAAGVAIAARVAERRVAVGAAAVAGLAVLAAVAQRRLPGAHVARCQAARRVERVDTALLGHAAGRAATRHAVAGQRAAPAPPRQARLAGRAAMSVVAAERAVRVVGSTARGKDDPQRDAAHRSTLS